MGFAKVLKSVLRQDPDVILVGEIRDAESAAMAAEAAMTGHLVLSSLHTYSAHGGCGSLARSARAALCHIGSFARRYHATAGASPGTWLYGRSAS